LGFRKIAMAFAFGQGLFSRYGTFFHFLFQMPRRSKTDQNRPNKFLYGLGMFLWREIVSVYGKNMSGYYVAFPLRNSAGKTRGKTYFYMGSGRIFPQSFFAALSHFHFTKNFQHNYPKIALCRIFTKKKTFHIVRYVLTYWLSKTAI